MATTKGNFQLKVQTTLFGGNWWSQPSAWITIGFLTTIFFSPWGPALRYSGWAISLVAVLVLCVKGQLQGSVINRPIAWMLAAVLISGAVTTALSKQDVRLWVKGFSQPVEFAFSIWLAAWVFFHVKNGIRMWLQTWYAGTVVFLLWGIVQFVKDADGELLFSNINSLGLYICMILPLLLGVALRTAPRSRLIRIGEIIMVVIAFAFLLLSYTTSAWVTVGLQLVLFFLFLPRARLKLAMLGGMILAATLIIIAFMQSQDQFSELAIERFEKEIVQLKSIMLMKPPTDADPIIAVDSTQIRLDIAKISLALFSERPIFGWGWGKYDRESTVIAKKIGFEGRHPEVYAGNGHSMYLNLMVRGGLVALLGVGLLHVLGAVRLWRKVDHPSERELQVPAMILIISILLYSLGGDVFEFRYKAAVLFWTVFGLAFIRGRQTERE